MNAKRTKGLVIRALMAVLLVLLFIALLVRRLSPPGR